MKPPEKLIVKFGKRFEASAHGRLPVILAFALGLATVTTTWGALSAVLLVMR
ncbi:hypothetical protein [Sinorhizobium meliloti]|uniref:hypothetical protein n=1 Tax=Rhizobium meliloti TaxID=382 RepID=UPI0013E29038|nr:hypothetical protein [Sinorhizobium meliloti]